MTIPNSITITETPAGEAPEWVRAQWVGLILPLYTHQATPIKFNIEGVLSSSKQNYANRLLKSFKTPEKMTGFIVSYDAALVVLEATRPDAAKWWRQNTPHLKGSQLAFEAEVCDLG